MNKRTETETLATLLAKKAADQVAIFYMGLFIGGVGGASITFILMGGRLMHAG